MQMHRPTRTRVNSVSFRSNEIRAKFGGPNFFISHDDESEYKTFCHHISPNDFVTTCKLWTLVILHGWSCSIVSTSMSSVLFNFAGHHVPNLLDVLN